MCRTHAALQCLLIVVRGSNPQEHNMLCARLAAAFIVELLLAVAGMLCMCCRVECLVASLNCCAAVLPPLPPCLARPALLFAPCTCRPRGHQDTHQGQQVTSQQQSSTAYSVSLCRCCRTGSLKLGCGGQSTSSSALTTLQFTTKRPLCCPRAGSCCPIHPTVPSVISPLSTCMARWMRRCTAGCWSGGTHMATATPPHNSARTYAVTSSLPCQPARLQLISAHCQTPGGQLSLRVATTLLPGSARRCPVHVKRHQLHVMAHALTAGLSVVQQLNKLLLFVVAVAVWPQQ